MRRAHEGLVEVVALCRLPGQSDLGGVRREVGLGVCVVDLVELGVRSAIVRIDVRQLLASEVLPEPPALHSSQVAHQAEQGQRRRWDAALLELVGRQPGALEQERFALEA